MDTAENVIWSVIALMFWTACALGCLVALAALVFLVKFLWLLF